MKKPSYRLRLRALNIQEPQDGAVAVGGHPVPRVGQQPPKRLLVD